MSQLPDDQDPRSEHGLDEDAAWREIVAHYGERPELGPDDEVGYEPIQASRVEPVELPVDDPLQTPATWEDEGHFVPPEPPPLPRLDPRRKLAWLGLLIPPVVLLVSVVVGFAFPGWLAGMLVAAFLGGFGYLVATMPRSGQDDWPGDDGAVL